MSRATILHSLISIVLIGVLSSQTFATESTDSTPIPKDTTLKESIDSTPIPEDTTLKEAIDSTPIPEDTTLKEAITTDTPIERENDGFQSNNAIWGDLLSKLFPLFSVLLGAGIASYFSYLATKNIQRQKLYTDRWTEHRNACEALRYRLREVLHFIRDNRFTVTNTLRDESDPKTAKYPILRNTPKLIDMGLPNNLPILRPTLRQALHEFQVNVRKHNDNVNSFVVFFETAREKYELEQLSEKRYQECYDDYLMRLPSLDTGFHLVEQWTRELLLGTQAALVLDSDYNEKFDSENPDLGEIPKELLQAEQQRLEQQFKNTKYIHT